MAEQYVTFEDALKALGMQEAELRALVAQGRLRAFRDENMLKFRRSDVENLRKQRHTESTLVVRPAPEEDTGVPQVVPPEEPGDLTGQEFDDTAETLIGGDLVAEAGGDVELALEPPSTAPTETGTKVPTIELTAPDSGTEETEIPTLDLGEAPAAAQPTGDTEVPTMVLGLDEYDDTQVPTEDVATEEVAVEPDAFGPARQPAAGPALAPGQAVAPEEEVESGTGTGAPRATPPSAFGTGEALVVREQPSALYTIMHALAAFILLVPGAIFFYCVATANIPDWEFLKSVVKFFWDLLGIEPPRGPY